MMIRTRWLLAAGFLAASAGAQEQSVMSSSGFFRYNGDTIWFERDSSVSRTVTKGDTVIRGEYMNSALRTQATYVVNGAMATLIELRDANGVTTSAAIGRPTPAVLATRDRESLARAQTMAGSRPAEFDPPLSPATRETYLVGANATIVQLRDTAWYVTGCIERGKLDSATYVFYKRDSVRRVKPAPARTFGMGMVATLSNAMWMANSRKRLADQGYAATRNDVPTSPNACTTARPAPLVGERAVYALGTVYRYHNDTVWMNRDSLLTRVVYRGDTVERTTASNGAAGTTSVYVNDGDSARMVATITADGTRRPAAVDRKTPLKMLYADRTMLDQVLSGTMPLPGTNIVEGRANPVPRLGVPVDVITYDPSPTMKLLLHRDTLRVINSCSKPAVPDTSVFILFGADSARRLAPPRTFGPELIASFQGHIERAALRQTAGAAGVISGLPCR